MTNEIKIGMIAETDFGWEFEVDVDGRAYQVMLAEDYFYRLTAGKITPKELVERSFEFLLARESPSSILGEFDLKQINQYFPEYETEITKL